MTHSTAQSNALIEVENQLVYERGTLWDVTDVLTFFIRLATGPECDEMDEHEGRYCPSVYVPLSV